MSILLTLGLSFSALANECERALIEGPSEITRPPAIAGLIKSIVNKWTGRPFDASEISADEIREIDQIATGILEKYPSVDHVFVGLGRSPTPIMAYMQAMGLTDTINLPLSGMRNHPDYHRIANASSYKYALPLDGELEDRLFYHFSRFLPKPAEMNGKKLVLIDYAQRGASLAAAQAYIQEYYDRAGVHVDVIPMPLIDGSAKFNLVPQLDGRFSIPLKVGGDLWQHFGDEAYEYWSEYGYFNFKRQPSTSLKKKRTFQDLVQEFKNRRGTLH